MGGPVLESKAVSKSPRMTVETTAAGNSAQRSILADMDLFASIDRNVLCGIEQTCRYRRFAAQEQILDKDSAPSDVYLIVRGRARVVIYSVSGREITFADLAEGDYFGELSAIDGQPQSANVMAVEECVILALPRRLFLTILADYPQAALRVMQRLAGIIRSANERIMDLSTLGAHNRVQAELLRQARIHKTICNTAVIEPIPMHSDIASRVSTTRETVARVLNDLARKGIVQRTRTALLIRNMNLLNTMVEEVRG
jgi:CRP/FNR family transcriptional regulator, cyclic AMP receptor protein